MTNTNFAKDLKAIAAGCVAAMTPVIAAAGIAAVAVTSTPQSAEAFQFSYQRGYNCTTTYYGNQARTYCR